MVRFEMISVSTYGVWRMVWSLIDGFDLNYDLNDFIVSKCFERIIVHWW